MNTALLRQAVRFGKGYRKWVIPGFGNAVIAGPLKNTVHLGNWPGRILIRVPVEGNGRDIEDSLWSSSLPGARRKARDLIRRAIRESIARSARHVQH